jgi:hypothetical protein
MTRRVTSFRVVYTLLTANFLIPSLLYLIAPERALGDLRAGLALLGLPPFPIENEGGFVWRTLAGTNVLTLAFMCGLLLADVRRFYPLLLPLAFLKGTTALAFLLQYALAYRHPLFLGIVAWDGLAVFLMIFFASRARAALDQATRL